MQGFVDLHCHWVAGIDDGARDTKEAESILRGLHTLGFDHVVATPHMRPGLFDNDRTSILRHYEQTLHALCSSSGLPAVSLGSEHYFHEVVLERLAQGEALPYREHHSQEPQRGGSVLLEFSDLPPAIVVQAPLLTLISQGYLPVIAHPERYPAAWQDPKALLDLIQLGCAALLDTCALCGKYGKKPALAARRLLSEGAYDAACSDAHRPRDVELMAAAIEALSAEVGPGEVRFLLAEGPRALLAGRLPT